jgi:hypothetical protein
MMYAAVSFTVTIGFPFGGFIGSSKERDHGKRRLGTYGIGLERL